jgi:cytochrome c oxidase subunit 3/cytochrome o ubiquinol oxidase subunit 3
MSTSVTVPVITQAAEEEWLLPNKGKVGMFCLIIGETAIFAMFVIAYLFYTGKSMWGPQPKDVLELPVFSTIALLSSSVTIWLSEQAIEHGKVKKFSLWLGITILLGLAFLYATGLEWYKLIYHDGLTLQTNLFGTTFYSLVGLHASHVIIGLIMLGILWVFSMMGKVNHEHAEKIQTLALYWHFVDAVWVVVFTVVYVLGR